MQKDTNPAEPLLSPIPVLPRVIAVTGGSGLVGKRLLPGLSNAGADLRVLMRSGVATVPHSFARAPHISVPGDLLDPASLRELVLGANAVIHLAGIAHTGLRTASEWDHAYAVNAGGTRALLQAAREAGVLHFVLLSSAHVYAGQQGLDLPETSATAPDRGYAGMKLEAEDAAGEAATEGMRVIILRPCLIYGPGVRFNLQSLLRTVNRGFYVHARGVDVVRSLASVDTVAAAIAHILRQPEILRRPDSADIYNVADREPVRLQAWVDHLAELMKVPRPRAIPLRALSAAAIAGSAASALGLSAPLTRSSLRKLTSSFSINTDRLAASGFVWPQTSEAVLQQMIDAAFPA